jgi:hypothetical protein
MKTVTLAFVTWMLFSNFCDVDANSYFSFCDVDAFNDVDVVRAC